MNRDILEKLVYAGGALRLRDLRLTRTEYRAIAKLVAQGALVRPSRAVIALPETPKDVIAARYYDGVLTCGSAAAVCRLPTWNDDGRVHIRTPKGRRIPPTPAVLLHSSRHRTVVSAGLLIEPLSEALARFLRCSDTPEPPIVAVDAALNKRLLTLDTIDQHLVGPNSLRGRERLRLTSSRARSPLETVARLDLIAAGISFRDGVMIPGVGEVDFLIDSWLVVEIDGYEFHNRREQFIRDRQRDRTLIAMGYTVLRFTAEDVRAHNITNAILATLTRTSRGR